MSIPVLCIVGRSDSGKTTLLEKLIPVLKGRGHRIATIKHHSHAGFDIDKPGKDSWRHAQAGSEHVFIVSPDKVASYRLVEKEPTLDEIISEIKNVDFILVEGHKRAGKPSLEIIRRDLGVHSICDPQQLVAIAANFAFESDLPVLNLDEVIEIVDFVERKFLKN